jgi:hypothetical protein
MKIRLKGDHHTTYLDGTVLTVAPEPTVAAGTAGVVTLGHADMLVRMHRAEWLGEGSGE